MHLLFCILYQTDDIFLTCKTTAVPPSVTFFTDVNISICKLTGARTRTLWQGACIYNYTNANTGRIKGSFQRLFFHPADRRQWVGHESLPSKKEIPVSGVRTSADEFMRTCTSSDTQTHSFALRQWRSRGVKSKSGVLLFFLGDANSFSTGRQKTCRLVSYLPICSFGCFAVFFFLGPLLPFLSVLLCTKHFVLHIVCFVCAASALFWFLSCFPCRVNLLVCIIVVTEAFYKNLHDLVLISQWFYFCFCVSSLQTTGRTSETRLLLPLSAPPPPPTLCWMIAGRVTSQKSLQASFMDLPRLVKPQKRLTTSITPNPANMPLQTSRAACCRPRSSASWSEEDPHRSSLGQGASRRLSRLPSTPTSHRWCTALSSTQGSTRTRPDPETASRWIQLVAGLL